MIERYILGTYKMLGDIETRFFDFEKITAGFILKQKD